MPFGDKTPATLPYTYSNVLKDTRGCGYQQNMQLQHPVRTMAHMRHSRGTLDMHVRLVNVIRRVAYAHLCPSTTG